MIRVAGPLVPCFGWSMGEQVLRPSREGLDIHRRVKRLERAALEEHPPAGRSRGRGNSSGGGGGKARGAVQVSSSGPSFASGSRTSVWLGRVCVHAQRSVGGAPERWEKIHFLGAAPSVYTSIFPLPVFRFLAPFRFLTVLFFFFFFS